MMIVMEMMMIPLYNITKKSNRTISLYNITKRWARG